MFLFIMPIILEVSASHIYPFRSLVFHYVVQRADRDTDGIFPKPGGTPWCC